MGRTHIGLDIGTSAIRAAEITAGSPPKLVRFAQVSLPTGAVSDGEIADRAAVVEALRDLWKRGGFRRKRVHLSVANQKIVVRQVELPWMSHDELRGALQFQVQEYIPIPIEDAIVDFQVLEEFAAEDGARMMRILVVAAVREMINEFVAALSAAGLQPERIDYSGFALLRSLAGTADGAEPSHEAEAVLDIGAGVTNVVVHENGIPRFVRILAAGGSDVTEALVDGLGIPADEAERLKIATGLPSNGNAGAAERLIEQRVQGFVDDVRSSLEYHQAQPGAAQIARVMVVGGASRLPGLAERLSVALNIPVVEGRPLAKVKLGKLGFSVDQWRQVAAVSAVSLGLSLEAP